MLDFPRWKQLWYWALTLLALAAALPSLATMSGLRWPASLPHPTINLGLDLAGGSHLLLEANADQVVSQRLEAKEEEVRAALKKSGKVHYGDISNKGGSLSFIVANAAEVDAAREAILPLTNGAGLSGKRDWEIQIADTTRFILTPTQEGIKDAIDKAMETATEVVRKRIDAMGTREPTIIRQGNDRIVVQVPGLSDPAALKALLGQTAKLEFKLVDQLGMVDGVAAPGDEILPFANGAGAIAVKRLGGIKGDRLTDAKQSFGQNNDAVVSITFDSQGSEQFARLTKENVGKPFAIVLDGKVLSAPNINEPIMGGSAQISGSFTVQSANQLAIALRSGALPVDLKVVEERTVGPDLGADSIMKGVVAMSVATAAVVIFMAMTYGRFGMYANIAVILNVLMILGIMALLNTTLTLPGIAGFVLTIGAAVDANVLINERIREERKRGRKVFAAVEMGYKEASRTIFDANITHIISAVLMFEFGSGPIKGFAVVLIIGIITSVFTAVFLTRMWVAGWLRRARPNDLNI
ncbi:protein translocase subunit SecD [Novosphingobium umbonatum]|uniref:Protein translocase subunit SecD n=1 Tax=Novosphingobium umbonatum TaxID=1908524 RepID=A0A437MXG4_9SPHN|nr:protein translocase subunit SecD [Novosphingobium umbonatum]RVU02333.1 protein translocase subunit SecD [Novosphingobium umbonatum]